MLARIFSASFVFTIEIGGVRNWESCSAFRIVGECSPSKRKRRRRIFGSFLARFGSGLGSGFGLELASRVRGWVGSTPVPCTLNLPERCNTSTA